MSVKSVHLEVVSDLTSAAFIACLRQFIARRGKPYCIWSDHGSNIVGASRELEELADFLEKQRTEETSQISAPPRAFDGISSLSKHLTLEACGSPQSRPQSRVLNFTSRGLWWLTFEELTTVLTQVEACLNSRPLVSLPSEEDGIDILTF